MAGFGGKELNMIILEELFSSDSSDSDSEVINELLSVLASGKQLGVRQRFPDFVVDVVHRLSGEDFKSQFRMTRETFECILCRIGKSLRNSTFSTRGQAPLRPEKQLLLSLWLFATPESYKSVSDRFCVGKSTAIVCVQKVTVALCNLASTVIKWPKGSEADEVKRGFENSTGFPDAIGAVDATHIEIRTPQSDNPVSFVNKIGKHSIILQGVCNHKAEFTHCYTGQAGSVHASWVLQQSEIFDFAAEDGESKFPKDAYLLGGCAYPCMSWLMIPFKDDGRLTEKQNNFNMCLTSGKNIINRAFGLLKGRWRRLQYLDMHNTHFIPQFIVSCCVLHNICLSKDDKLDDVFIGEDVVDYNDADDAIIVLDPVATKKRIDIMDRLEMKQV